MAEIDNLEIKISADTSKAEQSINSFSNKIGDLSKKLNGVDYEKVDKTTESITKLGKSAKNTDALKTGLANISTSIKALVNDISEIDTTKLDKVVKLVNDLTKISGKQLEQAQKSIKKVNDNLGQDKSKEIKKNTESVEEFMKSIKELGKDKKFIGSESQLQTEIEKTKKKLQDYNIELDRRDRRGESVETKGWRTLQENIELTTNYLNNLLTKQEQFNNAPKGVDFWETPEYKNKQLGLDTSTAKEQIEKLEEVAENHKIEAPYETPDVSGLMKSWANETKKQTDAIAQNLKNKLEFKPTQLGDNQAYTKRYTTLANQITKAETKLENLIERQDQLDSTGVNKTSQRYVALTSNIEKAERELDNLNYDMKRLQESGEDVRFTLNTQGLSAKVQGISKQIESQISSVTNVKLGKNQIYTKEYTSLAKQINKAGKELTNLRKRQAILENSTEVNKQSREYQALAINIKETEEKLKSLTSDMQKLKSSGGATTTRQLGDGMSKASNGAKTLSQSLRMLGLGKLASKVQQVGTNFKNMSNEQGKGQEKASKWKKIIPILAMVAGSIVLITKAVKKVGQMFVTAFSLGIRYVKTFLKTIGKVTSAILGINKSAKRSSTSIGRFINKIVGILQSRILRQAITKVLEYAKNGINSLAVYSNNMGTSFNKNVSTVVSDMKYLGRVIATAFEPIVNIVSPMLDFLIGKFVDMINVVNQFINAITGSSTWTKASYSASNYAENVSDASDSVKELNKQTREWDKLNVITTSNDGSGSGSSSSSDTDGDLFTTQKVSNSISSLAKSIKVAWNAEDWTFFEGLGTTIGNQLANALDKIDWTKIEKNAEKVGKTLGSIINGFVKADGLDTSIANTISGAINTGISGISTIIDTTDFASIGTFVGNTVVKTLEKIKWGQLETTGSKLGKKMAQGINALLDTDCLDEIAKTTASLIKTGVNGWYSFVTTFNFSKLGTKIGSSINSFLKSMGEVDTDTGMNAWQKIGKSISKSITGILTAINTALETVKWEDVGKAIRDFITSIEWGDIFEQAKKLPKNIAKALGDVFKGITGESDFSKAINKMAKNIASFLKGLSWDDIFSKGGKLLKAIAGAIGTILKDVAEADTVEGAITKIGKNIGKLLRSEDWQTYISKGSKILKAIAGALGDIIKAVASNKDFQGFVVDGLKLVAGVLIAKSALEFTAKKLVELGSTVAKAVGEAIYNKVGAKTLASSIKDFTSGIADKINTKFSGMTSSTFAKGAGAVGAAVVAAIAGWELGQYAYENWPWVTNLADNTAEAICNAIGISIASTKTTEQINQEIQEGMEKQENMLTAKSIKVTLGIDINIDGGEISDEDKVTLVNAINDQYDSIDDYVATLGTGQIDYLTSIGVIYKTDSGYKTDIKSTLSRIETDVQTEADNNTGSITANYDTDVKINGLTTDGKKTISQQLGDVSSELSKNWTGATATYNVETKTNGTTATNGSAVKSVSDKYSKQWKDSTATYNVETKTNGTTATNGSAVKSVSDKYKKNWTGTTATYKAVTKTNDTESKTASVLKALNDAYHKGWISKSVYYKAVTQVNDSKSKDGTKIKGISDTFQKNFTGKTVTYNVQTQADTVLQNIGKNVSKQIYAGMSKTKIEATITQGTTKTKYLSLGYSITGLATGGFPEDGWFRASQGEIMGKFDNGKSVVANNQQITQGIADAVYEGNQENNALMRQELSMLQQQNNLLNKILEKETGISYKDVFNAVKKGNSEYKIMNGRSAFV